MNLTRRSFIAGTAAFTALSASRVHGANERIRLGFIGLGGRGTGSTQWFNKAGADIAFLCDPDQEAIERNLEMFPHAKTSRDMRELLDDDEVDAVVISTGNHWHALAGIWACQAGKDVYVEKPVAHNIREGRKLVEAARKYGRIVQGGTQQRSDVFYDELKAFLDTGDLGQPLFARCNRYGLRGPIPRLDTPLVIPDTIDYNLWLGPAQDQPLHRNRLHYDWHWAWNTGNGELGNWGPHLVDDLRNIVFRDAIKLPRRVLSGGGRLLWDDAGETPNTQFIYFDTEEIPVIMSIHNLPRAKDVNASDVWRRRGPDGRVKGIPGFLFLECSEGFYAGGRGGGAVYSKDGNKLKRFSGDGGSEHAANFLKALRSRNRNDLNAEVEEIHYSGAWCDLGNISWRLGQDYSREEAEARVRDVPAWNTVLDDFHAHLEANEIDPAQADIKLGAMLEVDAASETLAGPSATPEANALLTREYREGFTVPNNV